MTSDGSNTLTYDGQSRVTNSASGGPSGAYAFDGHSLRVKKTVSGATTVYIFSGTKVIAEYASGAAPSSPSKEYIYAGSQLLATITGSATNYHFADHLSPRLTTDSSGNILKDGQGHDIGSQGHFPFGETWYQGSGGTKWQFTSYERDSESGNDYAMMRTSINRLGRFSSLDPLAGSTFDPQSLNRYTYARNEPIDLIDPSGMGTTIFTGGGCMETSGAYLCLFFGFLGGPGHIALMLDTPDVGGNSGGNSGKRKFDCTLNNFIGSNFLLGAAGQRAMATELNRILNDAGVGVNVVPSQTGADFSIGLGIASSGNTSAGGDNLQGANFASVYLGTLRSVNPTASQSVLGAAAGTVAAHEFGHFVYPGQGDLNSRGANQWDIMQGMSSPFGQDLTFRTDSAKRDVLKKCKDLH